MDWWVTANIKYGLMGYGEHQTSNIKYGLVGYGEHQTSNIKYGLVGYGEHQITSEYHKLSSPNPPYN
jgi:hypothetical protein